VQAPDQIIAVIVLVNNLLSDDQRRPEFGLFGSETHHGADISLAREIEAGRRYADYRHAYTAELDAFDDNGGITCKPRAHNSWLRTMTCRRAHNSWLRMMTCSCPRVACSGRKPRPREETTAWKRQYPENTKEIRGHPSAKQEFGAIRPGKF